MTLGLFVGLSTLDMIYLASGPPQANQKLVAQDSVIAAGGPATNAAVTFAHLGNTAHLLTAMGCHPITHLMRSDLQALEGSRSLTGIPTDLEPSIIITDLTPSSTQAPPVSSIIVTQTTGERTIVSLNAQRQKSDANQIPSATWESLQTMEIILIDGHQIPVSIAIAQQAVGLPIVLDGGSWKPGLEKILPYIHYAICSADFYPPGCENTEAVIAYLQARMPEPARIAITRGQQPIVYVDGKSSDVLPIPAITPVDTLGAGDVFHGAFCHYILDHDFPQSLLRASQVAAIACQSFGTRSWLQML